MRLGWIMAEGSLEALQLELPGTGSEAERSVKGVERIALEREGAVGEGERVVRVGNVQGSLGAPHFGLEEGDIPLGRVCDDYRPVEHREHRKGELGEARRIGERL